MGLWPWIQINDVYVYVYVYVYIYFFSSVLKITSNFKNH